MGVGVQEPSKQPRSWILLQIARGGERKAQHACFVVLVGHLLHMPYSFRYVLAWGCVWVGVVSLVSLKLDFFNVLLKILFVIVLCFILMMNMINISVLSYQF